MADTNITQISDNICKLTQGEHDFLIIKKIDANENEKITSNALSSFENIKIICLDCLNHHKTFNHEFNPVVEVNPHIEVNSSDSIKKKAITFLTGAAVGAICIKYGIISMLGSIIINNLNLNITSGIKSLSSYLQKLNLFEKGKIPKTVLNYTKKNSRIGTPLRKRRISRTAQSLDLLKYPAIGFES